MGDGAGASEECLAVVPTRQANPGARNPGPFWSVLYRRKVDGYHCRDP